MKHNSCCAKGHETLRPQAAGYAPTASTTIMQKRGTKSSHAAGGMMDLHCRGHKAVFMLVDGWRVHCAADPPVGRRTGCVDAACNRTPP